MPKKNLYTAIKGAVNAPPHKDTGNNNIYTALGLKPKKVTKKQSVKKKK